MRGGVWEMKCRGDFTDENAYGVFGNRNMPINKVECPPFLRRALVVNAEMTHCAALNFEVLRVVRIEIIARD